MKRAFTLLISLFAGILLILPAEAQDLKDKIQPQTFNTMAKAFPAYSVPEYAKSGYSNAADLTERSDLIWNSEQEDWMEVERREFDYDETGRIEEILFLVGETEDTPMIRRTFDRNGSSEVWTEERYVGSAQELELYMLTTIEFDQDNPEFPERVTVQSWEEGDWVNDHRQTFTYSDGVLDQILFEVWDGADWENDVNLSMAEDNGDVIILEQRWNSETEDWENYIRETFPEISAQELFDFFLIFEFQLRDFPDLYMIESLPGATMEFWLDGIWVNELRRIVEVEYQNGNIPGTKVMTTEYWDGEDWEFEVQLTYSYDSEGNPVDLKVEVADEGGDLFQVFGEVYLYTDAGLLDSITNEEFDGEGLAPNGRFEFSWDSEGVNITAGPERPDGYELGRGYPNPFNPQAIIPYTMAETGHVDITLYDMLGRKAAVLYSGVQSEGTHEVMIDGSRLASGQYIVHMTAGSFTATRSVTLIK